MEARDLAPIHARRQSSVIIVVEDRVDDSRLEDNRLAVGLVLTRSGERHFRDRDVPVLLCRDEIDCSIICLDKLQ